MLVRCTCTRRTGCSFLAPTDCQDTLVQLPDLLFPEEGSLSMALLADVEYLPSAVLAWCCNDIPIEQTGLRSMGDRVSVALFEGETNQISIAVVEAIHLHHHSVGLEQHLQ